MNGKLRCRLMAARTARRLLAAALLLHSLSTIASAQVRADVYVSGLSLPVAFVQDPSSAATQYIVEQGGRIRVIRNGVLQSTDFLNLAAKISSGGERGLLGLAFPADYATSGRFYVNFTNPAGHTVVARFKRSGPNSLIADPASDLERNALESLRKNPEVPVTGIVTSGRKQYFQAIYPDLAVSPACVDCHNGHLLSPKRDFKLNDVMGGIAITIPLE